MSEGSVERVEVAIHKRLQQILVEQIDYYEAINATLVFDLGDGTRSEWTFGDEFVKECVDSAENDSSIIVELPETDTRTAKGGIERALYVSEKNRDVHVVDSPDSSVQSPKALEVVTDV